MTLLELLLRDEEIGPELIALAEEFEALAAARLRSHPPDSSSNESS